MKTVHRYRMISYMYIISFLGHHVHSIYCLRFFICVVKLCGEGCLSYGGDFPASISSAYHTSYVVSSCDDGSSTR